MRTSVCGIAVMAIAIGAVACGQGTPTSPSQMTSAFTPSGQRTVQLALASGDAAYATYEANTAFNLVQLGMLAEQIGDKRELKAFGRQIFQDYQDVLDQLVDMDGDVYVSRATFDSDDRATYDALRRLGGGDFDRAVLAAIIAELTSGREGIANRGASASVDARTHAGDVSSLMSRHLNMARDLETYF